MREEIRFTPDDRIAIIAPHPDDECLGASAALLLAADRTDVFVMTDGSHGNPANTIEEEAVRDLAVMSEITGTDRILRLLPGTADNPECRRLLNL